MAPPALSIHLRNGNYPAPARYDELVARVAILTLSDKGAAGERADEAGSIIEARLREAGHEVALRAILPDERELISRTLADWCDRGVADVIVTTGGTGLTSRDVTPEATLAVAERHVPGLATAILLRGLQSTPYAALSRGVAVVRGKTLIVNLAGSAGAARDGLDVLLPLLDHIAELLRGPVEHGESRS